MSEPKDENLTSKTPLNDPETDNLSTAAQEASDEAENADNLEESAVSSPEIEPEQTEKRSIFGRNGKKDQQFKQQIADLEKKNKELNDKFLLLYSEFDNYKKRTNKEKLELLSTASEKVIVSLLPVIDDFERAIKANENLEDAQVMRDGFTLIYNKLTQLLKRFDVEEIAAKGEVFDTDFHEAVTHFPAPTEEEKGKVIDVTEKGYKIKEKVIRYAKVVVGQ